MTQEEHQGLNISQGLVDRPTMAMAMVDCWQWATISMWVDKLDAGGALKLICDTFTWEALWEGAVELNQQVAAFCPHPHQDYLHVSNMHFVAVSAGRIAPHLSTLDGVACPPSTRAKTVWGRCQALSLIF